MSRGAGKPAGRAGAEFSKVTKARLAQRAGFRCSRPGCDAATIGPSAEHFDAVASVGEAAHIAGAASGPGSRRFDASMTDAQRKASSNGIWMCRTCAKMIDSDESTFKAEDLRRWKEQAERRAQRRLGAQQGTTRHKHVVLFDEIVASVEASVAFRDEPKPEGFVIDLSPTEVVPFDPLQVTGTGAGERGLVDLRIWTERGIIYVGGMRADEHGSLNGRFYLPFHPFLTKGRYVFEARLFDGQRSAAWIEVARTVSPPSVSCSSVPVEVGGQVEVRGRDFPPRGPVEVQFLDAAGTWGRPVAQVVADSRGQWAATFAIPTFEGHGITSAGPHPVHAHGFSSDARCEVIVAPKAWGQAVTTEVNHTTANGFLSLNIRRMTIAENRVLLDFSVLNLARGAITSFHPPALIWRGPDHECLGSLLGSMDEYDVTLAPGDALERVMEFAQLDGVEQAAASNAVPMGLELHIGGDMAGHHVGIDALLQLDGSTLEVIDGNHMVFSVGSRS